MRVRLAVAPMIIGVTLSTAIVKGIYLFFSLSIRAYLLQLKMILLNCCTYIYSRVLWHVAAFFLKDASVKIKKKFVV